MAGDSERARDRLRGRARSSPRSAPSASGCRTSRRSSSSTRRRRHGRRDPARRAARARPRPRPRGARRAHAPPSRARTPFTFIYTSGTTGPPKGCVLTHGNYRDVVDMCQGRDDAGRAARSIYLFLPLAHSFALLIQLAAFDIGAAIAYFGGDPQQIVAELMEVRPTYLPSVPRIFEKLYTLVDAHAPTPSRSEAAIAASGSRCASCRRAASRCRPSCRRHFDQADEQLFEQRPRRVRRQPRAGHHRRRADRPGDPRVLLRLRRAGARGLRA